MEHDTASGALTRSIERPGGRPIPAHPDALLHTAEAAFLLGLSARTLETLRLRGGGPAFIAVTRKAVRYRRGDLDAWVAAHRRKNTSDPGLPHAGGRHDRG